MSQFDRWLLKVKWWETLSAYWGREQAQKCLKAKQKNGRMVQPGPPVLNAINLFLKLLTIAKWSQLHDASITSYSVLVIIFLPTLKLSNNKDIFSRTYPSVHIFFKYFHFPKTSTYSLTDNRYPNMHNIRLHRKCSYLRYDLWDQKAIHFVHRYYK